MRNLHLEASKSTWCSPHTADQVDCPAERNTRGAGLSVNGPLKTLELWPDWCPAVSYHTVNKDAERNPEDEGKHHNGANYVISQELPWKRGGRSERKTFTPGWLHFISMWSCVRLTKCVDVQLVDKIPQPLDHILYLLHALSLFEPWNSHKRQHFKKSL